MDRAKILEYFNAQECVKGQIHVVGCGAIGSHVEEQLARLGCESIHLWDFDTVSPHNITNQMFTALDIGLPKVEAVYNMMCAINPDLEKRITLHPEGLQSPYILNGYVFMCVDSIKIRQEIVKANRMNPNCKAFFDFRMRLLDAQHYFADRKDREQMKAFWEGMDFTEEEAKDATPKSACGVELSLIYTVKMIASVGVANFVRFVLGQQPKTMILVDMNFMVIDAFPMEQ